ncbi:MAG TPA: NmrA family NAD(P)-binding protein, partial [Macromonas sp.]|nr:NmrA family NAD(P)-binding protein [Macromonas sp.]
VTMFVHSSVARAGEHEQFVDWHTGKWWPRYWRDKAAYNALVQQAGFRHHVVLKPAYMMENFIPPKALYMVPHLPQGRLLTAFAPETKLDLIAAADIGRFALAAFEDPARFHGAVIPLAVTRVTMTELARVISTATGKPVQAVHLTAEEALAEGAVPMVVDNHQWNNVEGYKVDLTAVAQWGIPLMSLEDWATQNRENFHVG